MPMVRGCVLPSMQISRENREDDLRQMRKTSLEACFNSSLSNTDKDLKFLPKFLQTQKTSMTDEQQKVVDEWEEIICADGAGFMSRHRCRFRTLAYYTGKPSR